MKILNRSKITAWLLSCRDALVSSAALKRLGQNTFAIAAFQAALVFCSLVLAWFLRFDFSLPNRALLFSAAPLVLLIRLIAIGRFGLFHGWWRYAGLSDVFDILKATVLGSAVFSLLMFAVLRVRTFPRSVYVLEAILTAGLLAGVRLLTRALRESGRNDRGTSKRVFLIGAGFAAQMILREISRQGSGYVAVACVDDDASKVGCRIHGVPVLGAVERLPALLEEYPADEIFIAVASATGPQMQRFVSICERTRLRFKTVPGLRDLIAGQAALSQLRDVHLDDLLGREQVEIDLAFVKRQIRGRVILVTGAAGSIGSELARQILTYEPAILICLDQSETGMFYLQLELANRKGASQLACCVADVGDRERMSGLLAHYRPHAIFHAAAYKHVPVMENNVQEAVKNNVFALLDLLEIAEECRCGSFVLVSSDKAVNPANVMGVTKRIGELIVACRPSSGVRCVSVRFGNVLGSSGSVIPILQEQLRSGEQLTITHPGVKRFFMTTREAVSLILQGFAVGRAGEILVLDMGEPLRVLDLARHLARLSGTPEDGIRIRFTGLRPGEKLYEELFYPSEEVLPTVCPKVRTARGTLASWPHLAQQLRELRASLRRVDGDASVRAKLKAIVPEYSYSGAADLLEEPAPQDVPQDVRATSAGA